ncbi:hypothetical protein MCOR27_002743 [Pyricularia oryzae]|uniref:ATPase AAA-type core domain-containing protein n=1 Tax=Pyricularia grisea TaxID=148305 RepID=A0ABQ8NZX2_PYRGI|nr:hypothetical protein MCOR19_001235 [Pyricularia oryzae]KAI6304536.1 hypothetical protein MCOR33_000392 [Pyricularia grisea]KAI6284614.1 hypothetical protein MCOR27_002743 [Pyricularia oryzae]KAI6384317.1 hypothetical protein MCOR32_002243 [Pyricularia oryzae]KAI6408479.1 hypothetical protein MCOR23_001375 [Pyricularia oryzae]
MSSSGKGEGLLILLSRPSTQAKLSQLRPSQIKPGGPFLNLQAEDLGLDAKVLGRKLKSALEVATEWGAVVLVDEADVCSCPSGTTTTSNSTSSVLGFGDGDNLRPHWPDHLGMLRRMTHLQESRRHSMGSLPAISSIFKIMPYNAVGIVYIIPKA